MTNPANIVILSILIQTSVFVPIASKNRKDGTTIHLTKIGQFGMIRKARPHVPQHYHTGIDIKRPYNNYEYEPIFPIASGIVVSKRTDGPYANIIIEHNIEGLKIWSLYEHIAGITVKVYDRVTPETPIARFMNKDELNRYGWQFDHFHLELLKIKPVKLQPSQQNPERFYNAYSLVCYTQADLYKYYFDPLVFLKCGLMRN